MAGITAAQSEPFFTFATILAVSLFLIDTGFLPVHYFLWKRAFCFRTLENFYDCVKLAFLNFERVKYISKVDAFFFFFWQSFQNYYCRNNVVDNVPLARLLLSPFCSIYSKPFFIFVICFIFHIPLPHRHHFFCVHH